MNWPLRITKMTQFLGVIIINFDSYCLVGFEKSKDRPWEVGIASIGPETDMWSTKAHYTDTCCCSSTSLIQYNTVGIIWCAHCTNSAFYHSQPWYLTKPSGMDHCNIELDSMGWFRSVQTGSTHIPNWISISSQSLRKYKNASLEMQHDKTQWS